MVLTLVTSSHQEKSKKSTGVRTLRNPCVRRIRILLGLASFSIYELLATGSETTRSMPVLTLIVAVTHIFIMTTVVVMVVGLLIFFWFIIRVIGIFLLVVFE